MQQRTADLCNSIRQGWNGHAALAQADHRDLHALSRTNRLTFRILVRATACPKFTACPHSAHSYVQYNVHVALRGATNLNTRWVADLGNFERRNLRPSIGGRSAGAGHKREGGAQQGLERHHRGQLARLSTLRLTFKSACMMQLQMKFGPPRHAPRMLHVAS